VAAAPGTIVRDGRLNRDAVPPCRGCACRGSGPGATGDAFRHPERVGAAPFEAIAGEDGLAFTSPPFVTDLALAIRRSDGAPSRVTASGALMSRTQA
jgi:hypothetical protein